MSHDILNKQDADKEVKEERKLKKGEFLLNGKRIQLKTRLPLKDYYDIPDMMSNIKRGDLRTQVPVFTRLVESWEFDGNPSDEESYGELDIVQEILPLSLLVQDWMDGEMKLQLKNSGREFGSASALTRLFR